MSTYLEFATPEGLDSNGARMGPGAGGSFKVKHNKTIAYSLKGRSVVSQKQHT